MVVITEDLIRKRAEHNECLISTLEEISLHQQDIERIEYIDKWCKELKILYLQSNLIPKIENLSKLKKLEYLNLALNNVERIENLEACESLTKLDMTVNFVGELTSIACLKDLYAFRELFLTGNPCTDYKGYREYVIATLPQLARLDGIEIEKSERIKAIQALPEIEKEIMKQEENHRKKRENEKKEIREKEDNKNRKKEHGYNGRWYTDINSRVESGEREETSMEITEAEQQKKDEEFWEEKTPFTPESRVEIHDQLKAQQQRREKKAGGLEESVKKERRLQTEDGRVLNVNEAGVDFSLHDDMETNSLVLDVSVFRHMDTSLFDVDVQTTYVKVLLKGKVLQIVLPEEVKPDTSKAQRSQVTGHLVITMPKVSECIVQSRRKDGGEKMEKKVTNQAHQETRCAGREVLEVDASSHKRVDWAHIATSEPRLPLLGTRPSREANARPNSDDFVDDPSVPPLV